MKSLEMKILDNTRQSMEIVRSLSTFDKDLGHSQKVTFQFKNRNKVFLETITLILKNSFYQMKSIITFGSSSDLDVSAVEMRLTVSFVSCVPSWRYHEVLLVLGTEVCNGTGWYRPNSQRSVGVRRDTTVWSGTERPLYGLANSFFPAASSMYRRPTVEEYIGISAPFTDS